MVSWLVLLVCVVAAFCLGVLFMGIVQYSRLRASVERSQMRGLEGVHPFETTSQIG